MLELLLFALAGILLGAFTGLCPGIHLNTACFFAASFAAFGDFRIAVLIAAMSVSHCFFDFIPSVFFGAPDDSEAMLSCLPGHRMLLEGKALEAVKLSALGCLFGVCFSLLLSPIFVNFAFRVWAFMPFLVPIALSGVLALMLFSEKGLRKKLFSIVVISLSGILGILFLDSSGSQNSLLALVSGFFAASGLLWSLRSKPLICAQDKSALAFESSSLKFGFLGAVAGSLVALLPSISSSEASLSVSRLAGEISSRSFLVMLGAISTANTVFGFFMLYFFEKTRNGSAVTLGQIVRLSQGELFEIIAVILFSAGIAFLLSGWIAGKFSSIIHKIDYSRASIAVLAFLAALVFIFSGFLGILAFLTASCIGIAAIASGIRRSSCMAFLMLPTLVFYLSPLIGF